jgi:hypothetical protein
MRIRLDIVKIFVAGLLSVVLDATPTFADDSRSDSRSDSDPIDYSYSGRAFYEDATVPSYTEHYVLRLRNGEPVSAKTEYREHGGTLRAERTLDFGSGDDERARWRPKYRFRDRVTGYEEGAEPVSQGIRVYLREGSDEALRIKVLQVPSPVVVDGGFIPFVRAHWDTLMKGARVPFHFVAVSQLDWFVLDLTRDASADRNGRVAFVAKPRHAALRLIVDPTRVWFDPATRRMVEFQGRSNLHESRGKTRPVRLTYSHWTPVVR